MNNKQSVSTIRATASLLIFTSGVAHIIPSENVSGVGHVTLLIFGLSYVAASFLIIRGKYFAGIFIPLAGLLLGLFYFSASTFNVVFVMIETIVIGLSLHLGFQSDSRTTQFL